jgi:hypothetical protein
MFALFTCASASSYLFSFKLLSFVFVLVYMFALFTCASASSYLFSFKLLSFVFVLVYMFALFTCAAASSYLVPSSCFLLFLFLCICLLSSLVHHLIFISWAVELVGNSINN